MTTSTVRADDPMTAPLRARRRDLRAGAAAVDITPTRPVPLGGYGARKGAPLQGVHDPIYAKALWLETPDARVCIVTTDLIGSTLEIRDAVKPADVGRHGVLRHQAAAARLGGDRGDPGDSRRPG